MHTSATRWWRSHEPVAEPPQDRLRPLGGQARSAVGAVMKNDLGQALGAGRLLAQLRVEGLSAGYGAFLVLRDLTLEFRHPGNGFSVLRFSLLVVALGDGPLLETHAL